MNTITGTPRNDEPAKDAGLSNEKIQQLKRQHGALYLIEVQSGAEGGDPLVFVFKKADRKVLSASAKVAQTDYVAAAEVIIKNTLVYGDINDMDDIGVFSAIAAQVETINAPRLATLKNL